MDLNKLDLNLFIVLDAIYSEGGLSAAAQRLCVSQPAVSASLSRLRDAFNDELFTRVGRKMLPTPAVEAMMPSVRQALSLMQESLSNNHHFDPSKEERVIRLSMNDLFEHLLLPLLYKQLEEHAPGITLQTVQLNRRDALRSLNAGNLDLILDVPILNHQQLNHRPILDSNYMCVVRKDHPVTEGELTLEKYLDLPHIHISSRTSGLGYVDLALERINVQRRVVVRIQHYLMVPTLIANTNLCATVPGYLTERTNMVALPLPFKMEPLSHHMYWHKNRDSDAALQWVIEKICSLPMSTELGG